MSGEFLLYQAPGGTARIHLRVSEGTLWLTQRQLAELYQVSVPSYRVRSHRGSQFRRWDDRAHYGRVHEPLWLRR